MECSLCEASWQFGPESFAILTHKFWQSARAESELAVYASVLLHNSQRSKMHVEACAGARSLNPKYSNAPDFFCALHTMSFCSLVTWSLNLKECPYSTECPYLQTIVAPTPWPRAAGQGTLVSQKGLDMGCKSPQFRQDLGDWNGSNIFNDHSDPL